MSRNHSKKPLPAVVPLSHEGHSLGEWGQLRVNIGQVTAVGNRGSQNILEAKGKGPLVCSFTAKLSFMD